MFDFLNPKSSQLLKKPFEANPGYLQERLMEKSIGKNNTSGAFSADADAAVASLTWLPDDMELLSREDIYAISSSPPNAANPDATPGLLLLPAGTYVKPSMLPKLIRHGAKPNQFLIVDKTDASATPTQLPTGAFSTPTTPAGTTLPEPLGGTLGNAFPSQKSAAALDMVLIDTNDKHLRKLIDTLTMSGVRMAHLHCSHDPAQLIEWVKRVHPAVLIVDESAHPLTSMVAKLNALRRTYNIEHVILTISPNPSPNDVVDRERILDQARQAGIEVVTKPLNTFAISKAVKLYKAKLALARQLSDNNF